MFLSSPIAQAIILGILQGVSEFLPISSSAHLVLLPWLLGWKPLGLDFDVALHAGTLLSVLIYFRKDLWRLSRAFLAWVRERLSRIPAPAERDPDATLALGVLVGTAPAAVVAGLFGDAIESHLRSPWVTVFTLAAFGLLLGYADRRGSRTRLMEGMRVVDGLLIGLAQCLALVPGVSRSGITITAALLLGLRRADAARFSFLLATPVIFLAALKAGFDLWRGDIPGNATTGVFATGIMVSTAAGFLCITYLVRFLQRQTYVAFVWYRLVLACFILGWLLL
jgi:undecaprenyl-diphosphatase